VFALNDVFITETYLQKLSDNTEHFKTFEIWTGRTHHL